MRYTFDLSKNLVIELLIYYIDDIKKCNSNNIKMLAKKDKLCVILYKSNKIAFMGDNALNEFKFWADREKQVNNKDIKLDIKEDMLNTLYTSSNTIGSDEVGTGDYFGPIIVTASYVKVSDIPKLKELGVKDSKLLSDSEIMDLGKILIETIPYKSLLLTPKEYNDAKIYNMNRIKAIMHNKVLYDFINNNTYKFKYVVVDKFVSDNKYFEYLKGYNIYNNIELVSHGENKCYSVAVASIISKYYYINYMNKLADKYGKLPRGSSKLVDDYASNLVNKYGKDILYALCKINFNNTNRVLNKH